MKENSSALMRFFSNTDVEVAHIIALSGHKSLILVQAGYNETDLLMALLRRE